jgi:hypothetical protein
MIFLRGKGRRGIRRGVCCPAGWPLKSPQGLVAKNRGRLAARLSNTGRDRCDDAHRDFSPIFFLTCARIAKRVELHEDLFGLVALKVGYDPGILPPRIFAVMVIMAVTTTLMSGPFLTLANRVRKNRASEIKPTPAVTGAGQD